MNSALETLCFDILRESSRVLNTLGNRGTAEVESEKDIVTHGDISVSHAAKKLLASSGIPLVFCDEELGTSRIGFGEPKYTVAFDDIDGTNNYARGNGVLPYCTIVTIFDSPEPRYDDAIVAGVINHPTGTIWHAVKGQGTFRDGHQVKTSGKKELDHKKTRILLDGYMGAEHIERLGEIYRRGWVSDFCTSGVELSLLASGSTDARINPAQKAHELGAGYLLVKEAGGVVLGFDGKPLDDKPYDFNEKVPIVAAATPELAQALLQLIGPAKS